MIIVCIRTINVPLGQINNSFGREISRSFYSGSLVWKGPLFWNEIQKKGNKTQRQEKIGKYLLAVFP